MVEGDQTRLTKGRKYLVAGALMASGAKAVSILVHRNPQVALESHSEIVDYSDNRPSVFKLDTIKA